MIHLWRPQKNLNFGPPPTSSSLYTIIQFWNFDLSRSHSWTSLIRIQNLAAPCPQLPWVISNSFLTANAYNIYHSHMYNKTDRKANSLSPIRLFVKVYYNFGVSISELQVKYKRSFRMETV